MDVSIALRRRFCRASAPSVRGIARVIRAAAVKAE
jgi:hypothetical protein